MPQIKVRGISAEKLCSVSKRLIDELVEIVDCPRDYFEIEHISSVAIREGNIEEAYPFIEVAWFDRGLEIQDKVAKVITNIVRQVGVESVDIAFVTFERRSYYENGGHF